MELHQLGKMRLRMVIVEASEHLQLMLSAMVKPIKGEFFLAVNAEDGFMLAKTVKPDLIIADYGFDGRGATLCQMVRRDPALREIPFIMLSAFGAHLSLAEYRETGCNQVVYKPFQCMDLFVAIEAAMARDTAEDARLIPVRYRTGECDLLDAKVLDQLIRAGEIDCFRRRDGLVVIGKDPIRREEKTAYEGAERRSLAV
jgi:CheY-like chemotaxis protein